MDVIGLASISPFFLLFFYLFPYFYSFIFRLIRKLKIVISWTTSQQKLKNWREIVQFGGKIYEKRGKNMILCRYIKRREKEEREREREKEKRIERKGKSNEEWSLEGKCKKERNVIPCRLSFFFFSFFFLLSLFFFLFFLFFLCSFF